MAEAVRDLLEAFYNVLYDTMFEAVALFMGERGGGDGGKGAERGGPTRESGEQVTSSGASGSIARGGV